MKSRGPMRVEYRWIRPDSTWNPFYANCICCGQETHSSGLWADLNGSTFTFHCNICKEVKDNYRRAMVEADELAILDPEALEAGAALYDKLKGES